MQGRAAVLAALVAVLTSACAHQRPASRTAERERLDQRQTEFVAALASRDADRTAALFADDAVLHVANMPPVDGRSAIREFYSNVFRFLSASSARPESTQMSGGGDMAYVTGSVTNEFRSPQGTTAYPGKYLLIWRRLAGDWLIVLYSVSSNQPDGGR